VAWLIFACNEPHFGKCEFLPKASALGTVLPASPRADCPLSGYGKLCPNVREGGASLPKVGDRAKGSFPEVAAHNLPVRFRPMPELTAGNACLSLLQTSFLESGHSQLLRSAESGRNLALSQAEWSF